MRRINENLNFFDLQCSRKLCKNLTVVNGNNIILMLLTRTLTMKMLKLIFEEGKSNFVNKSLSIVFIRLDFFLVSVCTYFTYSQRIA